MLSIQNADPFLRRLGQSLVVKASAVDHCIPSSIIDFDSDFDPCSERAGIKILRALSTFKIGLAILIPAKGRVSLRDTIQIQTYR